MELLKDYGSNFIYKLTTTTDNCVVICYYKYNTYSADKYSEDEIKTLSEETQKTVDIALMESLQGKDEDTSRTVIKRFHEDMYSIDKFNNDIVSYLSQRPNMKEIYLINGNPEHKILIEPKVFQAMCKSSQRLFIDLGVSGFRTDGTNFDKIEYLEFITGTWIVDTDSTVMIKDLVVRNGIINTYNQNSKASNALNIIIGNSLTGSRLHIYSTLKCNIRYSSQIFNTPYKTSRFSLPILTIFGQEIIENDLNNQRLIIFGFNRLNIGELNINDEVQYGNIIKLDNINIAVICGYTRTVSGANRPGNNILVSEVGDFKIYNIKYLTSKKSFVYPDSSILKIVSKENSELKKTFQIYDTEVINNTENKLNIVDIVDTTLEMLYLGDCSIGSNVDVFKMSDNSKLKRISYSGVNLTCDTSLVMNKMNDLALYKCNVSIKETLSVDAPKFSFMDSTINFKKFNITYSNGPILKCNFNNSQILGERLQFSNGSTIQDSKTNFTDSKMFVKEIVIDNFIVKSSGGCIKSKYFSTNGKSITFDNTLLSFYESYKKSDINILSSLTGKILLDNYDKSYETNINIEDEKFYFSTSSLSVIAYLKSPKFSMSTNTPINVTIERMCNDTMNFKLSNKYDFNRPCKIIKKLDISDITQDFKIINDSELIASVTKTIDEDNNTIFEIGLKDNG